MSKAKYRFFLRQDESTNENVSWFLVNQLKIKAVIDIKIWKKPLSNRSNNQQLAPDLICSPSEWAFLLSAHRNV